MKDDKTTSTAKTIKWVGAILGVAMLAAGVMSLMLKTEDSQSKESILRFAELGLLGLGMVVLSVGMEAMLNSLARIEEKTSEESEDDDGTDILA